MLVCSPCLARRLLPPLRCSLAAWPLGFTRGTEAAASLLEVPSESASLGAWETPSLRGLLACGEQGSPFPLSASLGRWTGPVKGIWDFKPPRVGHFMSESCLGLGKAVECGGLATLSPSGEALGRSVPSPGLLLPGSRPASQLSWVCCGSGEVCYKVLIGDSIRY